MLKEQRHYHILDQLRREGRVFSLELSRQLSVSEETIRRDLRELAAEGKLQRVYGGALPRPLSEARFSVRQQQALEVKTQLARSAARLLHDGQVILCDGGTTNLAVARQLPRDLRATIVTNSPSIAAQLLEHPLVEVIVLGGRLEKATGTLLGAGTFEALQGIKADVCLLGVCSLHPEVGISVAHSEEAHLKRRMIASAGDIIAVATADKLGTAMPYVVGPLAALTHLVTERVVPDEALEPYRQQGIAIVR